MGGPLLARVPNVLRRDRGTVRVTAVDALGRSGTPVTRRFGPRCARDRRAVTTRRGARTTTRCVRKSGR